jgi:hypothetical protein
MPNHATRTRTHTQDYKKTDPRELPIKVRLRIKRDVRRKDFTHERVHDPHIYCNLLLSHSLGELVARVNLSKIKKSKNTTAQMISFTVQFYGAVALGVVGIYAILREIEPPQAK